MGPGCLFHGTGVSSHGKGVSFHGRGVSSRGPGTLPVGRVSLPMGRVSLPMGRVSLPMGRVSLPWEGCSSHGSGVSSHGLGVLPMGRVSLPWDGCLFPWAGCSSHGPGASSHGSGVSSHGSGVSSMGRVPLPMGRVLFSMGRDTAPSIPARLHGRPAREMLGASSLSKGRTARPVDRAAAPALQPGCTTAPRTAPRQVLLLHRLRRPGRLPRSWSFRRGRHDAAPAGAARQPTQRATTAVASSHPPSSPAASTRRCSRRRLRAAPARPRRQSLNAPRPSWFGSTTRVWAGPTPGAGSHDVVAAERDHASLAPTVRGTHAGHDTAFGFVGGPAQRMARQLRWSHGRVRWRAG